MEENQPVTSQPINQETPQPVKTASAMPPKKTIILIIALVLITIGLVYLSITLSPQTEKTTTTTTKALSDVQQTHFELSSIPNLDPISSTSAVQINYLDLSMRTGKNKVTAVQFEIKYEPEAITNIDIIPEGKAKNWAELIKKIDTQNGTISYALGINPGQESIEGSGVVAKLTYSEVAGFSGQTRITFLPKTMATAEGQDKSVLKTATGAIFSIGEEEYTVQEE